MLCVSSYPFSCLVSSSAWASVNSYCCWVLHARFWASITKWPTFASKVGEAVAWPYKIALEYAYNAIFLKERKDCCWLSLLLSVTNKKKNQLFLWPEQKQSLKGEKIFCIISNTTSVEQHWRMDHLSEASERMAWLHQLHILMKEVGCHSFYSNWISQVYRAMIAPMH